MLDTLPPTAERRVKNAGIEFALMPVVVSCYEAWISCAMMSARTERLKMLVAARPGYILPQLTAKMVSTFDQLSKGHVYVNPIAGAVAVSWRPKVSSTRMTSATKSWTRRWRS
jgi:alkanesulfonate monooxygenase SsuD/methylene tetrahydromethanopterin reductase-like flavin-dependent oxidoreductase (luciferase family)